MKIVVDTNVVLDALLDRKPHSPSGIQVLRAVELGLAAGALCATTLTTIDYLARRIVGPEQARTHLVDLLDLFDVARVDRHVVRRALLPGYEDYEDAVLIEAARQWGADAIVSRDARGFSGAGITVYTPTEFVNLFPSPNA